MVTPAADIAHEYYLSIVMDGDEGAPVIIRDARSGWRPRLSRLRRSIQRRIVRIVGDPLIGLLPYRARDAALALRISVGSDSARDGVDIERVSDFRRQRLLAGRD